MRWDEWVRAWLGAGGEIVEAGAETQGHVAQGRSKDQGAQNQEVEHLEKRQEIEKEQQVRRQETPRKSVRRRQRVLLNGKASQWKEVTASIIQGSTLGPTLAKCFSNSSHQGRNLLEEDKALVSKFADDEKRCRKVMNKDQGDRMQDDINHMVL